MPPQVLAAVATLLSFTPHGNRIELRLDRGAAEMTWVSPSTFRFRRVLDGPLPQARMEQKDAVAVKIDDEPGQVRIRSKFLDVTIPKRGVLVRVRKVDGTPLMIDAGEPAASVSGVAWERQSPAGARFYGLGPRTDAVFDVQGKAITAEVPFLVSTAGYGEYHAQAGTHRFDFATGSSCRIEAPAVDYYFHYGPTIKQIFEELKDVRGAPPPWEVMAARNGSWATLRATILRLVQGSMSAMLAPTLSLRPYEGVEAELAQRARQVGSLVDDVSAERVGLSGFRKQLDTFFATYAAEAHQRGFPVWHPLPFQFPDDPECARHTDEFMLGDEMLVAPIYQPGNRRTLYLPQGVWTNLDTNEVFRGRQTITVDTPALPVFARNGTILPLDSAGGMALHYFPTLAAEFFLLESDPEEWTQVHAAPAADIMRLEIESKRAREYQWVVHHIEKPSAVGFGDRSYREVAAAPELVNGTWFYDSVRRNLQVRVRVAQGEDSIINVSF